MAEPRPHISTSNRACCWAATCSTCFLTHGGRRPGVPERTRRTALCRENPGAFDVTERGHTSQNHPEEVDGVTRSYQGRRQAQRGQPLAPTADRARPPAPRVHSDSLAHPPGPRNKNHPAGEAGPRTRTRPPREARSAASIRRLPGEASVLHGPALGSHRGQEAPGPCTWPFSGDICSLRDAEAALRLPAPRYNPSSWAAWDDAPAGAGAGRGLSTGAQGLAEAEAGRGDYTHRPCSSPSPADGQMAGSFVIHSRKGDPDSPPPEPAALGGTESGSDGPTVHGGRRRAGLRPAA